MNTFIDHSRILTGARVAAFLIAAALLWLPASAVGQAALPLPYPETRTVDVVDEYHGTLVPDPYRWLEEIESPEVQAWVEAQNTVTFRYMEEIPRRAANRERLTDMQPSATYNLVAEYGGRYFFQRRATGQDHALVYWQASRDSEPRVLLDPGALTAEGGAVRLDGYSVSPDGRLVLYVVSTPDQPRSTRVREVDTGRDLADLGMTFVSAAWTRDGKGVFYVGGGNLRFHRIGSHPAEDTVIFEPSQPNWVPLPQVSECGRYVIIHIWAAPELRHQIYYLELDEDGAPNASESPVPLIEDFDAMRWFIASDGPVFYFHTDQDAPRGKIVSVDIRDRAAGPRTVVPQQSGTLQPWGGVSAAGDYIVANYLEDVVSRVRLFTLDGEAAGELPVPGRGSVEVYRGGPDSREIFYGFTSFLHPRTVFWYDLAAREASVFRVPETALDAERFVTRQVFYESRDGRRVPMFITHRRDLENDGPNRVLLRGYGAHGIPLLPGYSPSDAVWLEQGGVLAVANVRGGGEYGEDWHSEGSRENLRNRTHDFVAAAEHLIEIGISSPERIGIYGHSAGGYLVSSALTQRPDLFGAAVVSAGTMDLLRFHKLGIGDRWIPEYGSPDDPEIFPILAALSPLHNIEAGTCYPDTLLMISETDETAHPAHPYKFAAALQAAQGCERPVLLRTEREGFHWGGPAEQVREREADRLLFLWYALGGDHP